MELYPAFLHLVGYQDRRMIISSIFRSRFPTFSRVSGHLIEACKRVKDPAFLHLVGYQDKRRLQFHNQISRFPTFSRVSGLIQWAENNKKIPLSYI